MKVCLFTAAAVLALAGAAHAQTAPATAPASDLTRDLNSGPPVPAAYIAPAPRTVGPATAAAPAPSPMTAPAGPAPSTATPPTVSRPAPATAAPAAAAPAVRPGPTATPSPSASGPAASPVVMPPRATPIPATPAPQPRAAPITPPTVTAAPRTQPLATGPVAGSALPAAVPAPTPATPPPPPSVSTVTVLDAAARGELPFTVTLPPGFEIVTGRPGPDFRIYTIRRGEQSFVMVYAGPASQFPIYSGQMIEAGGRASIVSTEDGVRHAQEHLFQRPDAPREIHVWTMSLDGADRAMAEGIAQSVDLRAGL